MAPTRITICEVIFYVIFFIKRYSFNFEYWIVSSEQREQIRRRQRAEMERQMNEIAADAGASKEQVDQAMKLARAVLNKKEDSTDKDENALTDEAKTEIEEEQLD